MDSNTLVRLQLWDIAGQERFGSMTRVYYRDAAAAVIMFDLTAQRTFDAVSKWKKDVDEKVLLASGEPVPCLLMGNKSDLPGKMVTDEEVGKRVFLLFIGQSLVLCCSCSCFGVGIH